MESLHRGSSGRPGSESGFTLVEMLISILILTFGLLAAGQLMMVAMGSASLARSKGSASVVAQNKIEALTDLFRQNPAAADLAVGNHGPDQISVLNPTDNTTLNRYSVVWAVSVVPDPRAGKVLNARRVLVTVTPIDGAGAVNNRVSMNKVINMTAIFSPRIS